MFYGMSLGNMPGSNPLAQFLPSFQQAELDHVFYYPSLDSTNMEAKRLRDQYPGQNVLIVAAEQTQGQGQAGRSWDSRKDMGIWMSLLIQNSDLLAHPLHLLSLYTGVIVQRSLQQFVDQHIVLKWPNDIMVGGKKLGGILTELQWSGASPNSAIIGIGLNIQQQLKDFPTELQGEATSLAMANSQTLDRGVLISTLIDHFFANFHYQDEPDTVTQQWNAVAWQFHKEVTYQKGDELLTGVFLGVDVDGRARMQKGSVVQSYRTGEIRLETTD
jgi:BirA family biotin operon repressor/biotin-[acetyl-CoA-carboxylase] ligase